MPNEPLKVLIAEDRPEDAEMMVRALRALDQPIDWRLVASEHDYRNQLLWPPHIILADYTLPQFNAPRALAILQETRLDIPLIVVTGSISEEVAVDCIKRGAVDYLLKDRLTRLPAAVTNALQEHLLRHEKRRTEHQLRDREERLRLALEAARMGTWEWNPQINRLGASEQAGPLFGLPRGDFFHTIDNFYAAIHPDDREAVRAAITAAITDAADYKVEFRVASPDPPLRWLMSQGRVERDHGGRPTRMLAVLADITDRVRMEQEANHRLAELAHVVRLTTMGSLVSEIAHELNQPLYAISNFSQACLNRVRQPEPGVGAELTDWLEQIVVQSHRAGEIIRRVYSFVRKVPPQKRAADINRLARECATLLQVNLRHDDVKLDLKLAPRLPPAPVDHIQVQQVLVNLLTNAIDAVRELPRDQRRITVETRQLESGEIEVAVRDRGPGGPEPLDKLFEAFFTTKPEGMGMGLAISRSIVEAHGGRLTAVKNPDAGLTFRFTLPTQSRNRADGK